jgi:hypothetical protein
VHGRLIQGSERLPARPSGKPGAPALLVAIIATGLVASVVTTAAQLLLMQPDIRRWPAILRRDSRFAAAILVGPKALTSAFSMPRAVFWASTVHLLVACSDAAVLVGVYMHRHRGILAGGAAYGFASYYVRLHLLTGLFPWIRQLRRPAYLWTHVIHGVLTAALVRASLGGWAYGLEEWSTSKGSSRPRNLRAGGMP